MRQLAIVRLSPALLCTEEPGWRADPMALPRGRHRVLESGHRSYIPEFDNIIGVITS